MKTPSYLFLISRFFSLFSSTRDDGGFLHFQMKALLLDVPRERRWTKQQQRIYRKGKQGRNRGKEEYCERSTFCLCLYSTHTHSLSLHRFWFSYIVSPKRKQKQEVVCAFSQKSHTHTHTGSRRVHQQVTNHPSDPPASSKLYVISTLGHSFGFSMRCLSKVRGM